MKHTGGRWLVAGGSALLLMAASVGLVVVVAQVKQPPLTLPPNQLPRPHDIVRATYKFAAEHPEVLSYMPCFCSCEMMGHTSNASCFVKTRAPNGDVTAWQDHGIVCPMCLAVGELAMNMHAAGKPVQEIRAAVETKYGKITEFRTPTAAPPKK
ncbi:MAG: PCYCGC motif-containing (lipo)protein [Vicinamibacterales bacterium]